MLACTAVHVQQNTIMLVHWKKNDNCNIWDFIPSSKAFLLGTLGSYIEFNMVLMTVMNARIYLANTDV